MSHQYRVLRGLSAPLGVTLTHQHGRDGVNVALYSNHADKVYFCLFDDGQEIRLPITECHHGIWRGFVPDVRAGQRYGFRVSGTTDTARGLYFNPQKLLVDPYAKALEGVPTYATTEDRLWFDHSDERDNADRAIKSIVVAQDDFDWGDDCRPQIPWAKTVIYEVNIKGFTARHPNVPANKRGTLAGFAEPCIVHYLRELGITAVELLPITHHLDELHLQRLGLRNYWGYNVIGHCAVDARFASDGRAETAIRELKTLVRTLHQAGIEVILDVVFNHTAEQGIDGPMLCQRGIDNAAYYWLTNSGDYENWSGCGNTLNIAVASTMRWVMDCLRYWVSVCHVDGFRFDLGSVLGRVPNFDSHAACLQAIYQDPVLSTCKMIVEPWDIGPNGYQLGAFPEYFAEWNDRYRDDMRQFWLQGNKRLDRFSMRLAGSSDIFAHHHRLPCASVNFITAHDGFCLEDLARYNNKHNRANGEENRDGHDHNLSYNHGVEGPTDNREIIAARERSIRALLATLCLSKGTPMLLAGDEIGHTQQGNNNTYCQDNTLTWLDWQRADWCRVDYLRQLLALRRKITLLSGEDGWWTAENAQWFTANGAVMDVADWHNTEVGTLQLLLDDGASGRWLLLIHADDTEQVYVLPAGNWRMRLAEGQFIAQGYFMQHKGIDILHSLI